MISIYIALRFQWKFAVPVLIALMHDILITAGVYALVGREVTASTVAALLTILGFSLYDTIIVFDRIRENMPRMPNAAFSQVVNRSMSEVLTRSLATRFCTLLPVLALLLFGGETLGDFAFALLVGIAPAPTRRCSSPVRCSCTGRSASRSTALAAAGSWTSSATCRRSRWRRPVCPSTWCRPSRGAARPRCDPSQGVGQEEFDEMVANLGVESQPGVAPPAALRGGAPPAASGRSPGAVARAGAGGAGRAAPPPPAPPGDGSASATPDDDPAAEGRQERRRAQGAPQAREAALMALLVWVMVGLAIWHFTIFLPDRFWGGIVGAFVGALLGGVIFGLIVSGGIPPRADTDLVTAVESIPGVLIGLGVVWLIGVRQEQQAAAAGAH